MSTAEAIPSPSGLPVLGNAVAFARRPFESLEEWATIGPVVELRFPMRRLYLISDPHLVETILHETGTRYTLSNAQRDAFAGAEDYALTTSTGDDWRRLRRSLHPPFTRDAIDRYGADMVTITEEHIAHWSDGEQIDLHDELRQLTVTIVAETLLGVDIRGDEQVVIDAADALVARADPRRFGTMLPTWIPTPTDRRLRTRIRALRSVVSSELSTPGGQDDERAAAVLRRALDRGELSEDEAIDNAVALLLAGSDTSALGLLYAWHELSDHPSVYDALRDEHDRVVGDDLPRVTYRDKLQTVEHAVAETLRLYPPTWGFPRRTLESVELGHHTLPAGAELLLSPWVLHRDPRFWSEPASFDPDRWQDDDGPPTYAYFPFGGGPRHCIGMHFARMEMMLVLATMVGQFRLEVHGQLTLEPALSLRPVTPLRATVHRHPS